MSINAYYAEAACKRLPNIYGEKIDGAETAYLHWNIELDSTELFLVSRIISTRERVMKQVAFVSTG